MATLSSTFRLAGSKGTDPTNINVAPVLSIGTPNGSGSLSTSDGSSDEVISANKLTDSYVFIRNTGASSAGNASITIGGVASASLKPQDFLFVPISKSISCRVLYDTAVTTVDWFYWTRS